MEQFTTLTLKCIQKILFFMHVSFFLLDPSDMCTFFFFTYIENLIIFKINYLLFKA